MQIGEQSLGTALGEPARPVEDVALEQTAYPRPVLGERAKPVLADLRADALERQLGTLQEAP